MVCGGVPELPAVDGDPVPDSAGGGAVSVAGGRVEVVPPAGAPAGGVVFGRTEGAPVVGAGAGVDVVGALAVAAALPIKRFKSEVST